MLVRKSLQRISFILLTAALALAACNVGAAPAPTTDVNAINTAALATAMAQISAQGTQTALAAPTSTSLPTNTSAAVVTFAAATAAGASPTGNTGTGALPTISFNSTPVTNSTNANTTPLAGFTPLATSAGIAATASLGDACNNSAFEGDVTVPDGSVMKPGQDFVKTWKIRNTGSCTWDEGFALVFIGGDRKIDPYDFKFKNSSDFVAPGEAIDISINLTAPLAEGKYQGTWRMQNDKGFYFGTLLSVYFEVKK
jgi:hypothetical protein